MGRRDQWKEVRDSMIFQEDQKGKSVEEREKMPEKACGYCVSFLENAHTHDGRGSCSTVKMGSDLMVDPPLLVMEGETGFITYFNYDGGRCPHFEKREFVDTDLGEASDPMYRRAHRQMEKK